MSRRLAPLLATLLATLWAVQAQAGLFDDEEARRQILDIKAKNEARFDQQAKAQLDLSGQISRQAEEIANLRGQVETLMYELDTAKKRQQDFYIDLDSRLRKLESGAAAPNGTVSSNGDSGNASAAPARDPAAEAEAYEAALGQFKAGKYKEAANAFAGFVQKFPDSDLAPNAQFWLANAWYAQGNCYKTIENHSVVVQKYANSPKAPDALLAIATCQKEVGNANGAKRSLETLVARYPGTPAADTAQQRLKKK